MKRKLAGLTSRCTTPCSWHAASARSMPRIIGAAVASEKGVQHSPTQFTPAALELDVNSSSSSSSFFGTTRVVLVFGGVRDGRAGEQVPAVAEVYEQVYAGLVLEPVV